MTYDYVDNFGALACLVKSGSRDPDIGRLAHVLSAILVSIRARPWMDYVRSAANIADLSRSTVGSRTWNCADAAAMERAGKI
eukprot:scaffold16761_cov142-Isochrysis_galbana.AAC.2